MMNKVAGPLPGFGPIAGEPAMTFRVFCNSLADWLDDWAGQCWRANGGPLWHSWDHGHWRESETRPTPRSSPLTLTQVRGRLLETTAATPNLTWLLLTKRPEGWSDRLHEIVRDFHGYDHVPDVPATGDVIASEWLDGNPPPNVWVGATVENRKQGLPRIDALREIPASVRFLSVEPLLEDLGKIDLAGIHWVIVGGESGPGARPMHPDWARSLRDQCVDAGVPFFFKQWGSWEPMMEAEPYLNELGYQPASEVRAMLRGVCIVDPDGTVEEPQPKPEWCRNYEAGMQDEENDWPLGHGPYAMHRVGKKAAGRELDGRTWDEVPEVAHAG
jgi:protein gp37